MMSAGRTLGSLLKSLRAQRGWTLKEMSDRTAIPFSTLSKVEHDRLTLSYDKLLQISERLHISMSELFAEPDGNASPLMARRSIGALDAAVQISTKNYDYYYLCAELRRKHMVPILTRVRARSIEDFGDLVRHAGEEFIYVLRGQITVVTEFYDPVTLAPGETIYIDSNMGHAYLVGEGCDEAEILAVCSSGEEEQMNSLLSAREEEPDHAGAAVRRAPQAKIRKSA